MSWGTVTVEFVTHSLRVEAHSFDEKKGHRASYLSKDGMG